MPPAEGIFFLMLLCPRSVFSTPSPATGRVSHPKSFRCLRLKQKNPLPLKRDRGQRVEPLMAR